MLTFQSLLMAVFTQCVISFLNCICFYFVKSHWVGFPHFLTWEVGQNALPILKLNEGTVLQFILLQPAGYMMHHQFNIPTTVRSAHTIFMCFVFIWEQTATCAAYSINWLVFIAEIKSVYSAVRTGSLNKAVCASSFGTNSDLCHLQHKLIGFYNRDEKCLQRGTDWVFK